MGDARVSLTRRIAASPAAVFRVITDPRQHVDIDGSGMLVATDARPLRAVGDTFDMDMDREPLGDLPMGKYKVRNTVTSIVPDSALEWNVGGIDQPPFGHVYGYALRAAGPASTDVTLYCDWTGVRPGSIRDRFPIVPVHMLEKSLENLERIVTGRGE
jgi:Polyketide cyclase / dehydrase and lipid transport